MDASCERTTITFTIVHTVWSPTGPQRRNSALGPFDVITTPSPGVILGTEIPDAAEIPGRSATTCSGLDVTFYDRKHAASRHSSPSHVDASTSSGPSYARNSTTN